MNLGLRSWAQRSVDEFSVGDYYGASVAHGDVVRAALRYNVVERVLLFLDRDIVYRNRRQETDRDHPAGDLLKEFGEERVETHTLYELETNRDIGKDLLFLTGSTMLASHAAVRSNLQGNGIPISCILHSVRTDNLLAAYLYMRLLAESWDTLIATSSAGHKAVCKIFEQNKALVRDGHYARGHYRTNKGPELVQLPLGMEKSCFLLADKHLSRKTLSISDEDIVILYLGRLTESFKADLEPLLLTFRRLRMEFPNLVLLLCGQDLEGGYSKRLSSLAKQFQIDTAIRVITNFPTSMKANLYSSADIFVSPVDNIQETFGLSILEAMASELPVIASDWSGYRDIVRHGITGFLVPTYWSKNAAGDATKFAPLLGEQQTERFLARWTVGDVGALQQYLHHLIAHPEVRQAFGREGRQVFLAEFSWDSLIKRYSELWKKQLALGNATGAGAMPRRCMSIDYDTVFAHYASGCLGTETLIRWSGGEEEKELLWNRTESLRDPELSDEIKLIAETCQKHPQRLCDLGASRKRIRTEAAIWLVKKGYCSVDLKVEALAFR